MPMPSFSSRQTVQWHGVYLVAGGLVLFLVPGLLRPLLPFPVELDWWNRVLALPLFNLGVLCIGVARSGSEAIVKLTVAMRLWVMASLAILALLRLVPVAALAVGVIDLTSAALTIWTLVVEARRQPE